MLKAISEVKEYSAAHGITWHEAANSIGVGRVVEAHRLRGLYP
jgi:glutamate dehydrogenase (NAD(P)+)